MTCLFFLFNTGGDVLNKILRYLLSQLIPSSHAGLAHRKKSEAGNLLIIHLLLIFCSLNILIRAVKPDQLGASTTKKFLGHIFSNLTYMKIVLNIGDSKRFKENAVKNTVLIGYIETIHPFAFICWENHVFAF